MSKRRYVVVLKDVEEDEVVSVVEEAYEGWDDDDWKWRVEFEWTENDWSCDCNRARYFGRESPGWKEWSGVCTEGRYVLQALIFVD